MVMNCPVDYEDSNYHKKSKLMMYQDNPETSSQECVGKDGETSPMMNLGIKQKMAPTISWLKDRPKIQNLNKIQDTYDVVEGDDTMDTIDTDNLLPIKVRWKDIAETDSATEKDGKD